MGPGDWPALPLRPLHNTVIPDHNTVMTTAFDDGVQRVFAALESGELDGDALTTRRVCAFLGYTTGHLYHHFGSLDALLCAVADRAYHKLAAKLGSVLASQGDVCAVAQAFVEFGIANEPLYALMFERRFDWAALRQRGQITGQEWGLVLWRQLVSALTELGAREPVEDARLLTAGLHGLVSLALSGRANVGSLERSDREVAVQAARRLAERIVAPTAKRKRRG
jgi:AcrR family transcriptional regulator